MNHQYQLTKKREEDRIMAKRKKVIVLNDDPEKKAAAECLIGQLRKIGVDLGPQYRPEIVGMIARDNGFHVPEILRPCG